MFLRSGTVLQEVVDVWRWQGAQVSYLDSSMLVYGSEGRICTIDYSNPVTSFNTGRMGTIRHSGDQLVEADRQGKQTINVRLTDLVHPCSLSRNKSTCK